MSARQFYLPDTQAKVKAVVERIEAQTSAEVVVRVRPLSGYYRHTDFLVGFIFALAGLCVFLFHPDPFREDIFPLEMAVLFIAGAAFSAVAPDVRRLLTLPRRLRSEVERAARASLVELGVTNTRHRTGVLVYVSLFERRVIVVPDTGVAALTADADFAPIEKALSASVKPPRVPAFVDALALLGPALAKICPRRADDVNELPDEMPAA